MKGVGIVLALIGAAVLLFLAWREDAALGAIATIIMGAVVRLLADSGGTG